MSSRPQVAAKKYVYAFGAGEAEGDGTMRDLLGGKGAGLAEMTVFHDVPRDSIDVR